EGVELAVYEVATGERKAFDVRVARYALPTWSPDSKRLLVRFDGVNEREINIYDVATGKLSVSLYTADQVDRGEQNRIWRFQSVGPVFSRDGKRVADITRTRQSGVIKVWDAESGKDLLMIPFTPPSGPSQPNHLHHLAFTPDNHKLLAVTTRPDWGG